MSEEEQEQQRQQQRWDSRPVSTIAQNFAADLDSMFGLSPDVENLSKTVEEKKQTVSSGEQELQELEARLREAEQRLARVSRHSSPSRAADSASGADNKQVGGETARAHPLAQKPSYPADRPPTSDDVPITQKTQTMMTGMPGAMPATPQQLNGSNEYVMVDRSQRGYG